MIAQILSISLKDFFKKEFLKFTFVPLFFSFLLLFLLVFYGFSFFNAYLNEFFTSTESAVLAWIYSFAFIKIIFVILSFLSAGFIVVFASVFFAVFIISFLTPLIVNKINAKYYKFEKQSSVGNFSLILNLALIFLKFLIFFFCATLLLLVPFVNLFIYYFVFYYLFHKLLMLDVASCVLPNEAFKSFNKNFSPSVFKLSTFCFYLLCSVPFLGLFLQVFFVIFLTHLFYQEVLKVKCEI